MNKAERKSRHEDGIKVKFSYETFINSSSNKAITIAIIINYLTEYKLVFDAEISHATRVAAIKKANHTKS